MKRVFLIIFFLTVIFVPMHFSRAAVPVKILLVPGHDAQVWGAQYGNTKEADMTLALATRIYNILKKDKRFEVHITRDAAGYTKEFTDYFATHRDDIITFKENAKKDRQTAIDNGEFFEREAVPHVTVSENTSVILYGINKWADENKVDAVIHIHFNDYPRAQKWIIGTYSGFAIYMPDGQMNNWLPSSQLAADIFTQLKKKYITSTYPKEKSGMVPDQKLIAMGSNGTLNPTVRSVLIEYGYIYEKKFRTSAGRIAAYKDMSVRTATGITNYFFQK